MAIVVPEISRTFSEYLLLPNLTRRECIPANVSLRAPLTRHRPPAAARLNLNVPLVSAMMQSVSDDTMAVALARCDGHPLFKGFVEAANDYRERAGGNVGERVGAGGSAGKGAGSDAGELPAVAKGAAVAEGAALA